MHLSRRKNTGRGSTVFYRIIRIGGVPEGTGPAWFGRERDSRETCRKVPGVTEIILV